MESLSQVFYLLNVHLVKLIEDESRAVHSKSLSVVQVNKMLPTVS